MATGLTRVITDLERQHGTLEEARTALREAERSLARALASTADERLHPFIVEHHAPRIEQAEAAPLEAAQSVLDAVTDANRLVRAEPPHLTEQQLRDAREYSALASFEVDGLSERQLAERIGYYAATGSIGKAYVLSRLAERRMREVSGEPDAWEQSASSNGRAALRDACRQVQQQLTNPDHSKVRQLGEDLIAKAYGLKSLANQRTKAEQEHTEPGYVAWSGAEHTEVASGGAVWPEQNT